MSAPIATKVEADTRRRPNYIAGLFWTLIAIAGIGAAVSGHPTSIFVTLIAAPYAVRLWRGGRVVIWIW